jgi:hypothetical protein
VAEDAVDRVVAQRQAQRGVVGIEGAPGARPDHPLTGSH